MPSVKQKAGETKVQLYDVERTALAKSLDVLSFVYKVDPFDVDGLSGAIQVIQTVLQKYPAPPKKQAAAK
jgi:hypothetical protein